MGISKGRGSSSSTILYIIFFNMMFFALFALVAVAAADQAWEDYKLEFNKHYTAEEEPVRYANWKKDTEEVGLHNAMFANEFTQGVNELSDLSDEEYKRLYLSSLLVPSGPSNATMYVPSNAAIPNAVDWRQQGCVTPVKNQGRCGSCYSFSATGALEGAWKKARGSLPNLSEQQIVDCSGRYGNHGCQGGRFQSSWQYLTSAGGDEGEYAHPYTARQGYCRFDRGQVQATVSSYQNIRGESSLTQALGSIGPVSVAIDASPRSFRQYRGGVYYDPRCSSTRMNHAVLAVGYGSEGGRAYYLVKNSWSTQWGAGGYIKMARNRGNLCGIASDPAYPIV